MAKINLKDFEELETIDRLYSFTSLLDILLNIEGFLDDLHIYAYDSNWYRGEVVSGPSISRYWVSIVLKFDEKYMPDPEVIKVLSKAGCKVHYEKGLVEIHDLTNKLHDNPGHQYLSLEKAKRQKQVWYVEISIPKKLIYNTINNQIDQYEDEVDLDAFDGQNADEDGME